MLETVYLLINISVTSYLLHRGNRPLLTHLYVVLHVCVRVEYLCTAWICPDYEKESLRRSWDFPVSSFHEKILQWCSETSIGHCGVCCTVQREQKSDLISLRPNFFCFRKARKVSTARVKVCANPNLPIESAKMSSFHVSSDYKLKSMLDTQSVRPKLFSSLSLSVWNTGNILPCVPSSSPPPLHSAREMCPLCRFRFSRHGTERGEDEGPR